MGIPHLAKHGLKVVLIRPQIPPNTGQIGRLCVAAGAELHLVRPMGFVLSDRQLKRAAMDYWQRLTLSVHDDVESFLNLVEPDQTWLFSSQGKKSFWDVNFHHGDWLVFGNENQGLPKVVIERFAERLIRIPQMEGERCLNLATAVG